MPRTTHSRRDFLNITGLGAASLLLPRKVWGPNSVSNELTLYIGTYTSGKSEGIYIYRMNSDTGELKHFKTIKGVGDPSFLAIDRKRLWLYAVNEVEQFE